MKNRDYWKKRFKLLEQSQNQSGIQCYADIEKQYRQAQRQIEGQLSAWYQRFATNNNITIQEAKKMLTNKELAEFKWDIQDYIKYGEENAINGAWVKQLENASSRYHISRLEALKLQTQQSLEVLFGNQLDSIDSTMKDVYTSGYYHTAFEIQRGIGVGWDFATLDEKLISKVINKPWAADGKNFSERIWGNRQKLVNELNTTLTQNIILGQDPQKAIDTIAKKMNVSKNSAGALVMTEEAFFSSVAQKDCFNELDVEQFEIVATLDSHTSEICREMDGKIFPMSQYEIGVTAPPFHVRCRSTTVPYFDDEFDIVGERAARGEDGKTYHVPADMTYKEWKQSFVDGEKTEEKPDYLVRSHIPGQNIKNQRMIVNDALDDIPEKVQQALQNGTIIDIGKDGASQYDYINDILYVAKGAEKTDIIHEIGHMVENKLLVSTKVEKIKEKFLMNVPLDSIVQEIYYDADGNPVEIFLLKSEKFVSDYQGRLYVTDWPEIYDENWNIRPELLQEFMSEPFREYIENPERMKKEFPEFYELIKEAVE